MEWSGAERVALNLDSGPRHFTALGNSSGQVVLSFKVSHLEMRERGGGGGEAVKVIVGRENFSCSRLHFTEDKADLSCENVSRPRYRNSNLRAYAVII